MTWLSSAANTVSNATNALNSTSLVGKVNDLTGAGLSQKMQNDISSMIDQGKTASNQAASAGAAESQKGMQFSTIAISQLTRIRADDPQRVAALLEVRNYINRQLLF